MRTPQQPEAYVDTMGRQISEDARIRFSDTVRGRYRCACIAYGRERYGGKNFAARLIRELSPRHKNLSL